MSSWCCRGVVAVMSWSCRGVNLTIVYFVLNFKLGINKNELKNSS